MLQKIKIFSKIFFPVLLLGLIFFNIYQNWNLVVKSWANSNPAYLLISFFIMLLIYLEAALNFHFLIKAVGYSIKFKQSIYIFIVSNASRYIPGSIWQYIGRVELAKRIAGIPRTSTALSLILEVFILINAALITSILALPFIDKNLAEGYLWVFLIPASLLFLHPKIANLILNIIAKVSKKNLGDFTGKINFKKLIFILPYFILNFLLNGLALFLLTQAIFPSIGLENILLFSGIFAFSWAVGYLSFFAPAGLGVTDVLFAYLLSFQIPFSLASTIALSYRVLLTIAEMLVFVMVLKINTQIKESNINTKSAWEERSRKFKNNLEGVSTKSLPPIINHKLDKWMIENIESQIKILNYKQKNFKVLDLGCGYGRLSKPLLNDFKNLKTYGVDVSKTYVDLYNEELNPRGKAIQGDIKKLNFKNKYFDLVFIVTTLMYLIKPEDQRKALKEILRVTKPGGKIIIIERSPSGYFLFTMGGIIKFLRGKNNAEIPAVSIDKNELQEQLKNLGVSIEVTKGIPFLSLFLPLAVLLVRVDKEIVNQITFLTDYLDWKFSWLLWPSLYLSYIISKPKK